MHQTLPAFTATSGPHSARLVLVGEAWGESEAEYQRPFIGESGKELFRMLWDALQLDDPAVVELRRLQRYDMAWLNARERWLESESIALTNVFALRPPGNSLEQLCDKRTSPDVAPDLPALARGLYLRTEYLGELDRLFEELAAMRPNLVVALGNTATWALLRATNIGSIRGAITQVSIADARIHGLKLLPTYHPAGVMRQWSWRPIVMADLMKARREAEFPEVRRLARQITISPSLAELQQFTSRVEALPANAMLACDTETEGGQIKTIGFALSPVEALTIPLIDHSRPGWSYWPAHQERLVWDLIERLLSGRCRKVWQNGLYDLQYIGRLGLRWRNCSEDTMLLHHSHFPELQKGLGFLGSIYTNEAAWKLLRRHKADTEKRDE